MARAISVDLRERVVAAQKAGSGGYAGVAKIFSVGEASVSRWMRLDRERGSVEPRPHAGRASRLTASDRTVLLAIVSERSDATLAELADELAKRAQVKLSVSGLHKILARLGITRKKKTSTRPSATATTCGCCGGSGTECAWTSSPTG